MKLKRFTAVVWKYYHDHGRYSLPWRKTSDPYRILVSEVMLQQTQVSRVLTKYPEFLKKFPNVRALATASTRDVLTTWQGLGYNRRALLLKRTAEVVMSKHQGKFPSSRSELEALPGIGQSTSGALMAFAFKSGLPFIETNIRAVYIHAFFKDRTSVHDRDLLPLIEKTIDVKNPREWFYALMDYGVHLKSSLPNPSRKSVHHATQSTFVGSDRQLRASILRFILEKPRTQSEILKSFKTKDVLIGRINKIVASLEKDGFITCKRNRFAIA